MACASYTGPNIEFDACVDLGGVEYGIPDLGTVSFYDGTMLLATVPLDGTGVALF